MSITEPTGSTYQQPACKDEATSLPDRAEEAPRTDTHPNARSIPEVLGIDMIRLCFPIEAPRLARAEKHELFSFHDSKENPRITFNTKGMPVFVWLYTIDGHWMASVRFNPTSHAINPRGWGGLPIGLLPIVLETFWYEAQRHINPTVALPEARLKRLDVCRDFQVSAGERAAIFEAAIKVPVPYATRRSMWPNARGIPQTVYASTKRQGCVRAYDHSSHHNTSPQGTMRVEAQGHSDWLARADMESVADLGPTTVTDFFTERFHWSGFGTPAVYEQTLIERLWKLTEDPTSGITPSKLASHLGRERLIEAGIDLAESNTNASTRRTLQRTFGIAHTNARTPEIIRLDPAHDEPLRFTA